MLGLKLNHVGVPGPNAPNAHIAVTVTWPDMSIQQLAQANNKAPNYWPFLRETYDKLNHWGLVTPYGVGDLDQHWFG